MNSFKFLVFSSRQPVTTAGIMCRKHLESLSSSSFFSISKQYYQQQQRFFTRRNNNYSSTAKGVLKTIPQKGKGKQRRRGKQSLSLTNKERIRLLNYKDDSFVKKKTIVQALDTTENVLHRVKSSILGFWNESHGGMRMKQSLQDEFRPEMDAWWWTWNLAFAVFPAVMIVVIMEGWGKPFVIRTKAELERKKKKQEEEEHLEQLELLQSEIEEEERTNNTDSVAMNSKATNIDSDANVDQSVLELKQRIQKLEKIIKRQPLSKNSSNNPYQRRQGDDALSGGSIVRGKSSALQGNKQEQSEGDYLLSFFFDTTKSLAAAEAEDFLYPHEILSMMVKKFIQENYEKIMKSFMPLEEKEEEGALSVTTDNSDKDIVPAIKNKITTDSIVSHGNVSNNIVDKEKVNSTVNKGIQNEEAGKECHENNTIIIVTKEEKSHYASSKNDNSNNDSTKKAWLWWKK